MLMCDCSLHYTHKKVIHRYLAVNNAVGLAFTDDYKSVYNGLFCLRLLLEYAHTIAHYW